MEDIADLEPRPADLAHALRSMTVEQWLTQPAEAHPHGGVEPLACHLAVLDRSQQRLVEDLGGHEPLVRSLVTRAEVALGVAPVRQLDVDRELHSRLLHLLDRAGDTAARPERDDPQPLCVAVYRDRRNRVARRSGGAPGARSPAGPLLGRGPGRLRCHDARAVTEPIPFFNEYPRFLATSSMHASYERLNARYTMLIDRHRQLLEGATVLDLASHDGRFTLAALRAGARHVVGVEIDDVLVDRAHANMAAYDVAPTSYEFVTRDMFRHFDELDEFDVVLCFGILYHINDHMQLLSNIAGVQPKWIIVDTKISQFDGSVIEVRSPLARALLRPGASSRGIRAASRSTSCSPASAGSWSISIGRSPGSSISRGTTTTATASG